MVDAQVTAMPRRAKRTKLGKKTAPHFAPYHSQFEKDLHTTILRQLEYEPIGIEYTVTKKYTPDFVPKGREFVIEAKGYFRNSEEARKYVEVKKSNPKLKIVFIMPNPNKKVYPGAKKRKDGAFMTMADWCDRYGFEYYTPDNVPRKYRR